MAITACATIVGVDDAQLDPTIGQPDARATTSSASSGGLEGGASSGVIDSGLPNDSGPCSGEACPCVKNADCVDPVYDTCEKNACRQCSTSPDSCPADQYCEPTTLACAPGCKNDAACTGSPAGPHCNPTLHRCVECVVGGDCTAPKICTPAGVCADACGGGGSCTGGKECCGTATKACVDTKTDRFNCGGCDKVCPGASPLCCDGKCVDSATDEANCGTCGTACSTLNATPTCMGGSCQFACTPTFAHCTTGNTGCDTKVDTVSKCGGCAIDCATRILNATGLKCATGKCDYTTCTTPFFDGDGNRQNGCEAKCGGLGDPCCASPTLCTDSTNRCDKSTNNCVACLAKLSTCTGSNDLCCNGCNTSSGKCQ